ncbi:flagellar hook-associated protein FlgK, partial [Escherichia coli]|nr:flagellar hook-associated protein FlgK [Escherichia coli]
VNVSGTANNKDSFVVKPVSDVIVNMELKFNDESKLAMASTSAGGESDNRNGQKLLDLQNSKLVGGNKSFNDAYASLVSTVGSSTAALK